MGVVWLARDEVLEREVAFKFVPEDVRGDVGAVDDLKRETRRCLQLTHPNIVRIHEFYEDESCAGIAMEYVPGETLAERRLREPNRILTPDQITPWLASLIEALEYAHHDAKIVHRDLKPSNLMLDEKGSLKVTDFGIARSMSDSRSRISMTLQGGISGTPAYMGPQQALGEAPAAADDIYSLGAMLYDLLAGKPPFYTGVLMEQILNREPPSIAARRAELGIDALPVPPAWESVILDCLSKDPEARPATARQLWQRLQDPSPELTLPMEITEAEPATRADGFPPTDPSPNGSQLSTQIKGQSRTLLWVIPLLLLGLGGIAWFLRPEAEVTPPVAAASPPPETPALTPRATPTPTPEPEPTPTAPEPTPTPAPEPTPEPTPAPSATPEPLQLAAEEQPASFDDQAFFIPLPAPGEFHDLETLFYNTAYEEYSAYAKGQILEEAQSALREIGLYTGTPDGIPGPRTQEAIQRLQQETELEETGLLDSATLALLELEGLPEATPPPASSSSSSSTASQSSSQSKSNARSGSQSGSRVTRPNRPSRAVIRRHLEKRRKR